MASSLFKTGIVGAIPPAVSPADYAQSARSSLTGTIDSGTSGVTALFYYAPGDVVSGFTRTGAAVYYDATGVVQSAATGVVRDAHVAPQVGYAGALLESAKTNLCANSEDLSAASFIVANGTITANAIAAPNGALTADKYNESLDTAHQIHFAALATLADSTSYTFSFYAKQGGRSWVFAQVFDKAGTGPYAYFDLVNARVGTTGGGTITAACEAVGNGWCRVSVTTNMNTGAGTPAFYFGMSLGDNNSGYTGTSTANGVYYWGFQLEAGAFASSYAGATAGASVTRNADALTIAYSGAAGVAATRYDYYYDLATRAPVEVVAAITTASTITFPVDRVYLLTKIAQGTQPLGIMQALGRPIASPSGVSATSALGAVTTSTLETASPTGDAATSAVGAATATGAANTSPTGDAATSALGTITTATAETASPAGVAATSAVGTATASGGASVAPSGDAATSALGAITTATAESAAPSGVSASAALGTATESGGASTSPTGDSAASALGSITTTTVETVSPAGIAATSGVGTPTATGGASVAPAGDSATAAVGSVTATNAESAVPSGVASSTAAGTPTATGAATTAPSGDTAASALGAITTNTAEAAAPSGVTASSAPGTSTPSGAASTTPTGTSGIAATNATPATGDGTAAPTGVASTTALGTITASGTTGSGTDATAAPAGVAATIALGLVTADGGHIPAVGGRPRRGAKPAARQQQQPPTQEQQPAPVPFTVQGAPLEIVAPGLLAPYARPRDVHSIAPIVDTTDTAPRDEAASTEASTDESARAPHVVPLHASAVASRSQHARAAVPAIVAASADATLDAHALVIPPAVYARLHATPSIASGHANAPHLGTGDDHAAADALAITALVGAATAVGEDGDLYAILALAAAGVFD